MSPLVENIKMKILNVSGDGNIKDISPLSKMIDLEELYLSGNGIENISLVSMHTKLNTLFISYTKVKNIEAIKSLMNLELIDLRKSCITDFSPIDYLKQNGSLKTIYGATAAEQDYSRCN